MSDASNQSGLDAARTRLETALSTLTQGVASSRDALDMAASTAEEKIALTGRVNSLEQENLKLHEQVAAFALQPDPVVPDPIVDDARISELETEKSAIENNYRMLKEKYAALQDEMEAQPAASPDTILDNVGAVENSRLKQIIAEMEEEKNAIKGDLDKAIAELETMLEDA